jgi:hypothetical protein
LEGFYQLSSSRMIFASDADRRYVVEISSDGSHWTIASDKMASANSAGTRSDVFPPGAVARYVRVTFDALVSLREIEVFGLISTR